MIRALYAMSGGHPRTMQWIQAVIEGVDLSQGIRGTTMKVLPLKVVEAVLMNSKCLFKSYRMIKSFVFAALTNTELPLKEGRKLTRFGEMVSESRLLNCLLYTSPSPRD